MLRNLIANFIDTVSERNLDSPFLALLSAMGFRDVHFCHGIVEFGKDFIAKKEIDGVLYQFAFQTKAGDIKLSEWRETIRPQMFEAAINNLSHPQFDITLPRKPVLVTTGDLRGIVCTDLQDFNSTLRSKGFPEIEVWSREKLIQDFENFGSEALLQTDETSISSYGNFFIAFSKSLTDELFEREIEVFSRNWINPNPENDNHLLKSVLEAEMLSSNLLKHGRVIEAIIIYIAITRSIGFQVVRTEGLDAQSYLVELFNQSKSKIKFLSSLFFEELEKEWRSSSSGLIDKESGPIGYLVITSKVLEILSLLFFLEDSSQKKNNIIQFLKDFLTKEKGTGHFPGDRFSVSLVITILALKSANEATVASELLRKSAIWLFDRYEKGIGLGKFDSDEFTETAILIGPAFDLYKISGSPESFLATSIADLSAFLGEKELYKKIINDIGALRICPNYWQPCDSTGVFFIDAEDIIQYPNVQYSMSFESFNNFDFAEHIRVEPRTFTVIEKLEKEVFFFLMLLLRDRYFPTIWPSLVEN